MSSLLHPIAISPVVREAVALKAEELATAKAAFNKRHETVENKRDEAVDSTTASPNILDRLNALIERVKTLDSYLERDDDLQLLSRFVEQARDDRSMSEDKLLRLEKDLKDKVDKYGRRLEVSELHVELLKEALEKADDELSLEERMKRTTLEEGFEMVDDGK
jgi:hypothetical protein